MSDWPPEAIAGYLMLIPFGLLLLLFWLGERR